MNPDLGPEPDDDEFLVDDPSCLNDLSVIK